MIKLMNEVSNAGWTLAIASYATVGLYKAIVFLWFRRSCISAKDGTEGYRLKTDRFDGPGENEEGQRYSEIFVVFTKRLRVRLHVSITVDR